MHVAAAKSLYRVLYILLTKTANERCGYVVMKEGDTFYVAYVCVAFLPFLIFSLFFIPLPPCCCLLSPSSFEQKQ